MNRGLPPDSIITTYLDFLDKYLYLYTCTQYLRFASALPLLDAHEDRHDRLGWIQPRERLCAHAQPQSNLNETPHSQGYLTEIAPHKRRVIPTSGLVSSMRYSNVSCVVSQALRIVLFLRIA